MPPRLAMAMALLATAPANAKRVNVGALAKDLGKIETCPEAARALGALGPPAAAAIGRLLDAVARGDRCTPAAERAVAALVRFDNQTARATAKRVKNLLGARGKAIEPFGRSRLVALFGRMARLREDGQAVLTALLDDPEASVARAAAVGLGANYPPHAELDARLDAMLVDPAQRMRAVELKTSAASCTRDVGWLSRAVELLALDPADPSYGAIVELVDAALVDPGCRLAGADHQPHPVFLLDMTAHDNENVAAHSARMLGRAWPNERIIAELAHRLVDPPHESAAYRSAVIDGLAQSGRKSALALELIVDALADRAPSVRLAATEAVAVLGPLASTARASLSRLARSDPDPAVRHAARKALGATIGLPIEPRLPSRTCRYSLPASGRVCCEPECPRWADRGTRATADPSRDVFAGIGVVPRGRRGLRPSPSALDSARAALRRYLSGFLDGAVRDYLRSAPRANYRAKEASRAERAFHLDADPVLRSNANRVATNLLARLDGAEVDSVEGRAALVTVSVDELLAAVEAVRHQAPRDLVTAIEARVGVVFDRQDLVARGAARAAKPDWVVDGSGWFVTATGLELRGLGAAGAEGDDGADLTRRAERRARAVLVDVLADFGARCLAEYRRDHPEAGNHLVTDAGWIGSAAIISRRWQDDGRWFALATLLLPEYLGFLARMPNLSSGLRRFCDRHGERIFRREAVVLEPNDAPVWPVGAAPVAAGRALPTRGNLVAGGVAQEQGGQLLVLTRAGSGTALLGLSATGERRWSRVARTPWRRAAALDSGGFLVAGHDPSGRRSLQLARLSAAGEVQSQHEVKLAGWSEVAGLSPSPGGSAYVAVGDGAFGKGRHRKVLLARVNARGRVQWTREVAGWGAVSLPGVVPLADGGVVVLASAVHCLDPDADPGCDGDAVCDWNAAHARCGWNKTLSRYAANGHLSWERPFKLDGRPSNLVAVDGGYLFASVSSGVVELVRLDDAGQLLWQRSAVAPIANIVEGARALRAHEAGVTLVGVTTGGDVLVLEHEHTGALLRQHRFGGRGRDVGHASFRVGNGMLVLADSDSVDLVGASPEEPHALYVIPLPAP